MLMLYDAAYMVALVVFILAAVYAATFIAVIPVAIIWRVIERWCKK